MIVEWVFRRGDERAVIDIVRTDRYYVVHVREPKGERWLTVATVLDALLEEADVERALTCGGWYLTDFLPLPDGREDPLPLGRMWRGPPVMRCRSRHCLRRS